MRNVLIGPVEVGNDIPGLLVEILVEGYLRKIFVQETVIKALWYQNNMPVSSKSETGMELLLCGRVVIPLQILQAV